MFTIRRPESTEDFESIRALCWEYRGFLLSLDPKEHELVGLYYPEDGYDAQIDDLVASCAPPDGDIRLVLDDGDMIGCGMYRALDPHSAEIKRVYLREQARGTGTGYRLMRDLIDHCLAQGKTRILLETGIFQLAAQKLYLSMGFRPCATYQEVPEPARDYIMSFELVL